METIKENSLVQLKSGGPVMTVVSFGTKQAAGNPLTAPQEVDQTRVNTQWFVDATLHQGTFEVDALHLISEGDLTIRPLSTETVVDAYTSHELQPGSLVNG
ncbi:MAG: putative small protein [Spirosoma sp.]|nr:putative small protein [Spirosoma sp.]